MSSIQISSQSQLDAALSTAKGGETLVLTKGNYNLTLSNKTFTTPVTIVSADANYPAHFSCIKLTSVTGMTFKSLDIGRGLSSTESPEAAAMAKVTGGGNITFDSNHIHGSMDGNALNDGIGLMIKSVNGVTVSNNEFEQLGRGAQLFGLTNLKVTNNNLHDIRSDGLDLSAVKGVLIDGNLFANFQRNSTDHPDAIQFQTINTTSPSSNIVIRNNVVQTGSGSGMQGIFMTDQMGTLPYQNVTINNNMVIGSNMPNGIMVSSANNLAVTNNTVVSPTNDSNPVWIRLGTITGTKTYSGNIADSGGQMTPQQAFTPAQLSLLTSSYLSKLTPSQLITSGFGYQLTSSTSTSGSTSSSTSGSSISEPVISSPAPTPTSTPTPAPTPTPTPTPTTSGTTSGSTTTTSTGTRTILIGSQSQLDAALSAAKGGEVLALATGAYSISLSSKAYASKVTITSQNASSPARLSFLSLRGVSNVTFKSLDIGRSLKAGENPTSVYMGKVTSGSSNITFDTVHVHGSLDGNPNNDGQGLLIDQSKNVTVTNSQFEQLGRPMMITNSNGVTLAGNYVHNTTSGIYTNGVTNLVQTSTAVTTASLSKVAVSTTSTYADATTAFAPASLSDTLAYSTTSTSSTSTAAASTSLSKSTLSANSLITASTKTYKPAGTISLSTVQTRQALYQLAGVN